MSNNIEDKKIIDEILKGNRSAFGKLVDKYSNYVFKVISNHAPQNQVEDIAQNAFIQIYRSLQNFSFKSSLQTWIYKITVRCCYDFWRKEGKQTEVSLNGVSDNEQDWIDHMLASESEFNFKNETDKQDAIHYLEWVLSHLKAEDRMALTLVYIEGKSNKEAAESLGWTEANVKVRCHRAKLEVRNIIHKARKGDPK